VAGGRFRSSISTAGAATPMAWTALRTARARIASRIAGGRVAPSWRRATTSNWPRVVVP